MGHFKWKVRVLLPLLPPRDGDGGKAHAYFVQVASKQHTTFLLHILDTTCDRTPVIVRNPEQEKPRMLSAFCTPNVKLNSCFGGPNIFVNATAGPAAVPLSPNQLPPPPPLSFLTATRVTIPPCSPVRQLRELPCPHRDLRRAS